MATLEGVWIGRWQKEGEAWRRQILRKFKDVGRSEGQDQVVHRETRYLGVKWPQRHNLMFDEKNDSGHVGGVSARCEKDVNSTWQGGAVRKRC